MSVNWEVRFSNSRSLPYFYDSTSGTSTWEPPAGLSDAEIAALPGAAQHLLGGGARVGAAPAAQNNAQQVRASHLLIKHKDSRRPSSWKEANITRTKEEAEEILRGHMQAMGSSPDAQTFAQLASVHSDCSSARSGGDLGFFARGAMQKAFEDATYALPVGGLSDVVSSDSGLHVILRTA